jgi:hypothetical protein
MKTLFAIFIIIVNTIFTSENFHWKCEIVLPVVGFIYGTPRRDFNRRVKYISFWFIRAERKKKIIYIYRLKESNLFWGNEKCRIKSLYRILYKRGLSEGALFGHRGRSYFTGEFYFALLSSSITWQTQVSVFLVRFESKEPPPSLFEKVERRLDFDMIFWLWIISNRPSRSFRGSLFYYIYIYEYIYIYCVCM